VLQAARNGQDPLRYALIVSQAQLVGSAAECTPSPGADGSSAVLYSACTSLEGWEGEATVGVGRAAGRKCGRCWNYSEAVGGDHRHPELCERCLPVIESMGFDGPTTTAAVAIPL
jgi:isoleucyl-tRNA synthetase